MSDAVSHADRQLKYRAKPDYPEKARKIQADYRDRNREVLRVKDAARKGERWAWMASLKDAPCMDCGVRYPPFVMDWDHRPDEIKLFAVSKGVGRTKEAVLAEVAKCDLVCANCHRFRTESRKTA